MKTLTKAIVISTIMMTVFISVSFGWNTSRNGFGVTYKNLVASADAVFLYFTLITLVFWAVFEYKHRTEIKD